MAGDRGRFELGRGDPLRARLRHVRNAVGLAVIAYGLVWSTGFRGFMPLDQSIVWDAAWRLLGGQLPFADFSMPNGLIPAALQAGLFAVLGVSWSSYVLHAALANALAALLVYVWLAAVFRRAGPAIVYALATAALFYPLIGTPFMDQHAVFISALLIALATQDGMRARAAVRVWLLLPLVATLAFLSKQAPSAWAVIWTAGMLAWLVGRGHATRAALAALGLGTMSTAAIAVAALAWSSASFGDLWTSLATLPGDIGRERLSWAWLAPRLADAAKPAVVVVAVALGAVLPMLRRDAPADSALFAGASGLLAISVVHVLLTDNSAWFGLGALPLAAGLAHALIERRVAGRLRHLGWIVAAAVALQSLVVLVDIGLTRAANELRRADWANAGRGDRIDRRLDRLAWALPPAIARDAEGETGADVYRRLLDELRARTGGFVLIGDATILYSLAGRPSAFPALWFHPGLTYPRAGHPARPAFDARLIESLSRYDVRTIVIDGKQTWTGARAGDFAPIAACIARAEGTQSIGRFKVLTVPPGCGSG
jgi:hypothetical protein